MKQVYAVKILVMILAVNGCTPQDPKPGPASGQATEQKITSQNEATSPGGATSTSVPAGENLEAVLPAKEVEALHASARALVGEFVAAFSSGNMAVAEAKLISKDAFDKIVAPGFRSILSSGLLAKNQQELANLIDALTGHKVESWRWKPGKLVKTQPRSAFSRTLIQITGGTIELDVDGTFVAVRLDQLVRVDGTWMIFQFHNL